MESIRQTPEPDEQPQPEPTIPMLVARITAAITRLLRLVRPAEADKIRETVDELGATFGELLETILRQAHVQSAEAVEVVLNRLDKLEARIAALEDERAREVGAGE